MMFVLLSYLGVGFDAGNMRSRGPSAFLVPTFKAEFPRCLRTQRWPPSPVACQRKPWCQPPPRTSRLARHSYTWHRRPLLPTLLLADTINTPHTLRLQRDCRCHFPRSPRCLYRSEACALRRGAGAERVCARGGVCAAPGGDTWGACSQECRTPYWVRRPQAARMLPSWLRRERATTRGRSAPRPTRTLCCSAPSPGSSTFLLTSPLSPPLLLCSPREAPAKCRAGPTTLRRTFCCLGGTGSRGCGRP
mmetsp:Transcript_81683/g.159479  ORF Transcript_81683/g.159479 Transcript_81683/m.159479 type:complete len:248 (+) Transcript_81683:213-956(+)